MKAKIKYGDKAFKPVTIEITFETQAQLDAFGTLMNFVPVCEAYDELSDESSALVVVREACEAAGGKTDETETLLNAIVKSGPIVFHFKNNK